MFGASDAVKADIFTACGIDLGQAGRTRHWAVFTVGGTMEMDNFGGNSFVVGDVGVSGTGQLKMTGTATIYGDLYVHTGGTLTFSGGSLVTGATYRNPTADILLEQAANDAQNASDAAFALAVSPQYASLTKIDLHSQNLTLTATGTCTVLRLTDFKMSGGSLLTLVGTTAQAFIINVTKKFSLTQGSRIVLAGGLTWDSVLFNVVGGGGDKVELKDGSSLSGILLAAHRKIEMSNGAQINGMVIGNSVKLTSGAGITLPITTAVNP